MLRLNGRPCHRHRNPSPNPRFQSTPTLSLLTGPGSDRGSSAEIPKSDRPAKRTRMLPLRARREFVATGRLEKWSRSLLSHHASAAIKTSYMTLVLVSVICQFIAKYMSNLEHPTPLPANALRKIERGRNSFERHAWARSTGRWHPPIKRFNLSLKISNCWRYRRICVAVQNSGRMALASSPLHGLNLPTHATVGRGLRT
jgi:hypothetical protein